MSVVLVDVPKAMIEQGLFARWGYTYVNARTRGRLYFDWENGAQLGDVNQFFTDMRFYEPETYNRIKGKYNWIYHQFVKKMNDSSYAD